MATRSTVSTPTTTTVEVVASNAPTGKWQHPRFDEIQQRLNTSTFGERNAKSIVWNLIFLATTISIPRIAYFWSWTTNLYQSAQPYPSYLLLLLRLLVAYNIIVVCLPLFGATDDLSDIPLTPSQRALLGLTPASAPSTPGSRCITPPKYSRSTTPRSGSGGRSLSGSPYSGSPLPGVPNSNPYSPSASPLFHKAVGRDAARKLSFGSPSPLSMSKTANSSTGSLLSNSPSPVTGKASGIAISNRWLYERGRSRSSLSG